MQGASLGEERILLRMIIYNGIGKQTLRLSQKELVQINLNEKRHHVYWKRKRIRGVENVL